MEISRVDLNDCFESVVSFQVMRVHKIWFGYNEGTDRWETTVLIEFLTKKNLTEGISGSYTEYKAWDFVKRLRDDGYVKMAKALSPVWE